MDYDINRDKFSADAFETKQFLNNLYNSKTNLNESDIVLFKFQVMQREIANEIEINSANVLRASKTIINDLNILGSLHSNLLTKVESLAKQSKDLSFDPERAITYINSNNNISQAIEILNKKRHHSLSC